MKIATWNVNGIRARATQFLEWLAAEQPHVVCLQETKAAPSQLPMTLIDLDGYWCYWHGMGGYSGVALHLRQDAFPAKPIFHHPDFDYEARIVAAETPNFSIASVYVPNGGRDLPGKMRFLQSLAEYVSASHQAGKKVVLCGDMNIAHQDIDVHPRERKPRIVGQLPEEREIFTRILQLGLIDVARKLDPNNDQMFTWWAPWRNMKQRNIGWRIDYILASESVGSTAQKCLVFREIGTSDHAPMIAEFNLEPTHIERSI